MAPHLQHPDVTGKYGCTNNAVDIFVLAMAMAAFVAIVFVINSMMPSQSADYDDEMLSDEDEFLVESISRQCSYQTFKDITYCADSISSGSSHSTKVPAPTLKLPNMPPHVCSSKQPSPLSCSCIEGPMPEVPSTTSPRQISWTPEPTSKEERCRLRETVLPCMQARAIKYLTDKWGSDMISENQDLHKLAHQCISESIDLTQLTSLERMIDYRDHTMQVAAKRVNAMKLDPATDAQTFDHFAWLRELANDTVKPSGFYDEIYSLVLGSNFIPRPREGEGLWHERPVVYVAAALWAMAKDVDKVKKMIGDEQIRLEVAMIMEALEHRRRFDDMEDHIREAVETEL